MIRKNRDDFGKIYNEFIGAYSNIADENMILEVTAGKINELWSVSNIVFLVENMDNFTALKDNENYSFSCDSKLVNWLKVNRTVLPVDGNIKDYIKVELNRVGLLSYSHIFPLINLNHLLAIAFIELDDTKKYKRIVPLMESIFTLCSLSYDNARRIRILNKIHDDEKERNRLFIMEKMVSVLAHEIKNPLTSIRSSIQFIAKKLTYDTELQLTHDLIDEVDRIGQITHEMLEMTNPTVSKIESIDISELLNKLVRLNDNLMKEKKIDFAIENKLTDKRPVLGNETALMRVFSNLLSNSINALKETIYPKIEIDILPTADGVVIGWNDNGIGMTEKVMNRAFEPFFSTKSGGYGLGLAFCRKLLKQLNSDLRVTSNPGVGTRFTFKLIDFKE